MEWERAKTYIIFLFVLLNLGLGGLRFAESRRYIMTPEQERSILSLLQQNNIIMHPRIMRHSPPMRQLNVSAFYYDNDMLIDIFFDGNATHILDPHQYIFEGENSRLTILNGFIWYGNPYGFRSQVPTSTLTASGQHIISHSDALTLTNAFMLDYFPTFRKDVIFDVYDDEGSFVGVHIFYTECYQGHLVQSNFINIFVTPVGITQIEMQFGRIDGHSGTFRPIFAQDEVLLTFVQLAQRIRPADSDIPIVITSMDLVYFAESVTDQRGGTGYTATPFYRIFIEGNEDIPFLINAFTNVSID